MERVSLPRTLAAGAGASRLDAGAAAAAAAAAVPWFGDNRYDPARQAGYLLRLTNLREDLLKQQEEQLLSSVQRFYSQENTHHPTSRSKPKPRSRRTRHVPGPDNHKRLQMEKTRRLEAKRSSSNVNTLVASLEGKSVCDVPSSQDETPSSSDATTPRSQDIINAQQAHISQLIAAAKGLHAPSPMATRDAAYEPRQVLLSRRRSVEEMKPLKMPLKVKRWAKEPSVVTKTQPQDLLPEISRLDISRDLTLAFSRDASQAVSRDLSCGLEKPRDCALVENKCEGYVRGPCTTPVAWVPNPNYGGSSKPRRVRTRSKTSPPVKPLHRRADAPPHPLKFIYVQPNAGKPLEPPGAMHRRHSLTQISHKGDIYRDALASRSSFYSRSSDSPSGHAPWSLNIEIPFGGTVPLDKYDRVSSNSFRQTTELGSVSSRRNSTGFHSPAADAEQSTPAHCPFSIVLSEPLDEVAPSEDSSSDQLGFLCKTYKQNELRHKEMSNLLDDIKELNQVTLQLEEDLSKRQDPTEEGV